MYQAISQPDLITPSVFADDALAVVHDEFPIDADMNQRRRLLTSLEQLATEYVKVVDKAKENEMKPEPGTMEIEEDTLTDIVNLVVSRLSADFEQTMDAVAKEGIDHDALQASYCETVRGTLIDVIRAEARHL